MSDSVERARSEFLAQFYKATCVDCTTVAVRCPIEKRIQKCLKGNHIVGTFSANLYTVRNDYPKEDPRHWNFEEDLTNDELSEAILCLV